MSPSQLRGVRMCARRSTVLHSAYRCCVHMFKSGRGGSLWRHIAAGHDSADENMLSGSTGAQRLGRLCRSDFESSGSQATRGLTSGVRSTHSTFRPTAVSGVRVARVLSGLQTSVATHLAYYYVNDSSGSRTCAPYPNTTLWLRMVGAHRDRIDNLHFTYMLLMRAVCVVRPALQRVDVFPRSGNETEDALARQLLEGFLRTDLLHKCAQTFDERLLFQGEQRSLLPLYRSAFRNISRIMNCVGCERCNLWGKVQTRGLGTALRILFGDVAGEQLTRNGLLRCC